MIQNSRIVSALASLLAIGISAPAASAFADAPEAGPEAASPAKRTLRASRLRTGGSGEIRVGSPVAGGVTEIGPPIAVTGRVNKPAVFIFIERAPVSWDELQGTPDFVARIEKDARGLK